MKDIRSAMTLTINETERRTLLRELNTVRARWKYWFDRNYLLRESNRVSKNKVRGLDRLITKLENPK